MYDHPSTSVQEEPERVSTDQELDGTWYWEVDWALTAQEVSECYVLYANKNHFCSQWPDA